MKTFFFFDASSGVFSGSSFSGSSSDLERQLSHLGASFGAYEGDVDVLRQRLDLTTKTLVEYQPPMPAETDWFFYAWDEITRTWCKHPKAMALAFDARVKRDTFLASCDWTQLPDSPLTDEKRAQWSTYRKALRDLTDQADFPSATQWPEPPNTPTKKDKP